MVNTIELTLTGKPPSKKNHWRPRKGGGIMIDRNTREAIDRIAMQVPGSLRDLRLISPDVDFYLTYTAARGDRDNMFTCIVDILVKMGVFSDDRIGVFNGRLTIHPAVKGDYDGCRIVITPRKEDREDEADHDDKQPQPNQTANDFFPRTPDPAG